MPPIIATTSRFAYSEPRWADRRRWCSASRISCRAAAPGRTLRHPRRFYYVLAGELTVIAGGKETVVKQGDSCYIGPNESREIVNRGHEVCTIAVAVAPVK